MSAIRLTFSVDAGKPSLDSIRRVTMRVPPARHMEMIDTAPGTWLEVRDKDKTRIDARVLDATVLSPMVEVRTGVGDPGLTLVKSKAKQMMHVVVPDDPAAATFHILQRDKKGGAGKEILSGKF